MLKKLIVSLLGTSSNILAMG